MSGNCNGRPDNDRAVSRYVTKGRTRTTLKRAGRKFRPARPLHVRRSSGSLVMLVSIRPSQLTVNARIRSGYLAPSRSISRETPTAICVTSDPLVDVATNPDRIRTCEADGCGRPIIGAETGPGARRRFCDDCVLKRTRERVQRAKRKRKVASLSTPILPQSP